MQFSTTKNKLNTFLDMVKLNGTLPDGKKANLINSFIIVVKNGKITASRADAGAAVFIEVEMPVNVASEGRLPIGDVDEFQKYLNRMGKDINITFDETMIILEDGVKSAKFPAIAEGDDVSTPKPYSKKDGVFSTMNGTVLGTTFEVSAMYLREIIKDSDLIGVRVFPINIKDSQEAEITVGEPQTSMITTRVPIIDFQGQNAGSQYSMGFANVFSNLDGHVKVYFGQDAPMIVENIDTSLITFRAMVVQFG